MKMKIAALIVTLSCVVLQNTFGQTYDKALFRESRPGFYQNSILRDDREVKEKTELPKITKSFVVDLSVTSMPNKIELYKNKQWHNATISQGNTGTCWCFSTTSFLESEVNRINHIQVKISELFTVYWEYVEKARRYIRERGNSLFAEGSEANATTRIWKMYGVVPADAYTGLLNGRKYHNHEIMVAEMIRYLESLKANASWNEDDAIGTIKSIMNHYLGEPPTEITVNGKKITPQQYLKEVIKINPDDYTDILSYKQEPYYQLVEYMVPDNWWHSTDYVNVPLDVYMTALKSAVRKGFTVSLGGDVSEPGFDRYSQCAVIPDFDIPPAYINEDARQFRFSNKTTTDDHGVHLVGYLEKDGKDWYLIKDSSAGSRNNDPNDAEFGYYFFSEDYVKLKMLSFMVHKDAVKELLGRIK